MSNARLAKLATALLKKQLVRFTRPLETGTINGYVLDIGPRWLILALLSDDMRFNGYQCFRLVDVRQIQVPHPFEAFAVSALKKTKQSPPKKPRASLATTAELLNSVSKSFPLVTIHREKADPGICEIGRVIQAAGAWLELLEIGPDAGWHIRSSMFRLRDITRIDFGGGYETALYLVGGEPPTR